MADGLMRAVRIHRYGGPEVLIVEDVPRPDAGSGELLVRVMAAGVNPVDWKTRKGQGAARRWEAQQFPLILGWDVSGVVEAVGAGVEDFGPGDEVFGMVRFPEPGCCYAEFVAVPAAEVVPKPDVVDYRTSRFEDEVGPVDVVLDGVGGDTLDRSFDVLGGGGRLVSLVADPDAGRAQRGDVEAGRILVHPMRRLSLELASWSNPATCCPSSARSSRSTTFAAPTN